MAIGLYAQTEPPQKISELITPYKYKTHYLEIDSLKIAYIDEGAGDETILFIHGLATYLPSWDKLIEQLKTQYRCIAVDLPGYGRSSKGDYPSTMSFYTSVLQKFSTSLKLDSPVLCGHSMGGQVAITYALKHPEFGSKLILIAPAGIETFDEQNQQWFGNFFTAQAVASAREQQVRYNYDLNFYQTPADVEFMINDRLRMAEAADFMVYCNAVAGGVQGMLNEPVFDQLGKISQQTLIVYGENDNLIPNQILHKNLTTKEIADTAAENIPGSQLVMIPECGHMVPFEKPINLSNIIDQFLEE
ncbi:alpha/beta hydrolase [Fulvivirga sp. 29W222]|uniref:Alpha/beta hydrolase n=2 Tax=Fulvivirga marina TaxID=2494733 RepID=A0A937FYE0_9BACT|nr:alpha/beta hydrolase [Fulvivirga marina]